MPEHNAFPGRPGPNGATCCKDRLFKCAAHPALLALVDLEATARASALRREVLRSRNNDVSRQDWVSQPLRVTAKPAAPRREMERLRELYFPNPNEMDEVLLVDHDLAMTCHIRIGRLNHSRVTVTCAGQCS